MLRRAVVVVVLVLVGSAFAQVPRLISYQGRLSDAFGNPINGTRNITFRLYTDSTTSTAIWTETHSNVQISNGLYNVMLGSVTPFPSAVDFSRQYWLGVQVGSDPEMTPRYKLGASPYALNLASLGATDGQVLKWDATNSKWIPKSDSLGLVGRGTYDYIPRWDGTNSLGNSVIYQTDDGKIGIGTISPTHKVHILGDTTTLRLEGPGVFGSRARLNFGDGNYVYLMEDEDDKLYVYGDRRIALMGGKVGIGTTTPDYTLDVNGSLRLQPISAPTGAAGLIYYDSAENKFKCYQQGGIVNCVSNGVATKIVAASNSQNKQKADYVCDGTNDEAEINAAINALPATGGIVYLLEGTYNIASPITIAKSNVALIGSGKATVLKRRWASSSDQGVITVGDGTNAYEGIFISQLMIDGSRESYSSSYNHGIFFKQKISHSQIKSTWIYNSYGCGIYLWGSDSTTSNSYNVIEGNDVRNNGYVILLHYSDNNTITGNTAQGNSLDGILLSYSKNNTITGNIFQGTISGAGIHLFHSTNNTIIGNTSQGNRYQGILVEFSDNNTIAGNISYGNGSDGIYLISSSYNTISGNTFNKNSYQGINLYTSNYNTITGNKIQDNGGTGGYDGIRIGGDFNLISSNDITDTAGTGYAINISATDCDNNYLVGNRYSGTGASLIRDNGTGTIYGAQLYGSHLILKPNGNVGIGTTSPGYKLQVGNAGDGTEARANAWNIFSDIRLKTNLTKLTGALDKISQINGYYFNWNVGTDTRRQVGVIAQEVEKVLPEVVSEDSEGIKSVDYGKLSPLLIEAIKELKAENNALRAENDTLKAENNELRARIEAIEEKLKAGR